MNLEKAVEINSASTWLAFHLDGLRAARPEHLALIQSVTLAQMQTAKDVVEAHNQSVIDSGKGGRMQVVCEDRLLFRVKKFADTFAKEAGA